MMGNREHEKRDIRIAQEIREHIDRIAERNGIADTSRIKLWSGALPDIGSFESALCMEQISP